MTSRYTREIHTHGAHEERNHTRRASLTRRHQLLRESQKILYTEGVEPKKQHRTVWCHRHVVTEGAMPIFRKLDGSGARMSKVKTCGSVWACPVCASKVAEQRRQELTAAMVKHCRAGGYAYLVTFTFPHTRSQSLAELMEPFTKARQSFQNSRKWKAVMEQAGKVGVVNSLEVTYGSNGWHPHLHMLVFCEAGAFGEDGADEQGRLSSRAIDNLRGEWVRMLEKRGMVSGDNRHWATQYSFDVRGGSKAAEYIAKWGHDEQWGMSSELTSSHAKTGKRSTWGAADHYTPFQLLAMAREGDGLAMCAFREFVKEFDGKRMLTWSKGLKAHFGINEVEDEEAAKEPELALQDEHQIGTLEHEQLQVLTKYGKLGEFLAMIARYGHHSGQNLIDDYVECVARRSWAVGEGDIVVDRLKVGDGWVAYVPMVEAMA
jgi:Replication protein